MATAEPARPALAVRHIPKDKFHAGQPLVGTLDCGAAALHGVRLHYRHVNQAERWQSVELVRTRTSFQGEFSYGITAGRRALQDDFALAVCSAPTPVFHALAGDL